MLHINAKFRHGADFKPGLPTLNPEKFDAMFKEADTTGAGSIEFTEFMSMMSRKMRKVRCEINIASSIISLRLF